LICKLQEELDEKMYEADTIQEELKASEADADKLREDLQVCSRSNRSGGTFNIYIKFIPLSISRLP